MAPSLPARFLKGFLKRFVNTFQESPFDKIVVAATIIYLVGHGLITERWEFVVPLVWGVSAIAVFHAFKTSHALNKEISAESRFENRNSELFGADGGHPTVATGHSAPPRYRLKLYSIAIVFLIMCGYPSVLVWQRSRTSSTIATEVPVELAGWGLQHTANSTIPTSVRATVRSTPFSGKYRDKYAVLILIRVVENTVDENDDPIIDKSALFQIPNDGDVDIRVPLGTSASKRISTKHPNAVSIYLSVIPKTVNLEDIGTISSVRGHGGFFFKRAAFVIPPIGGNTLSPPG